MSSNSGSEKKVVTIREMARMLGIKKTDSYWFIHNHDIDVVVIGGKLYVMKNQLIMWIEEHPYYKEKYEAVQAAGRSYNGSSARSEQRGRGHRIKRSGTEA